MSVINTAPDLFNVKGMVAVITGGGSGLGAYAARALDANGAKAVYIIGRRKEKLDEVVKTAVNGSVKPIVGDVSTKESLEKIADQVRQEQGFINLLFANAGVIGPKMAPYFPKEGKPSVKEYSQAILGPDMSDFTATYHTNVTAVTYTVGVFLDLLDAGNKKQNLAQTSQIIVTSSIAGFSRQTAAGLAYSASKAAVTHLVKNMATAFSQNGFRIRANVIAPGFYPSEMTSVNTDQWNKLDGTPGHENAYAGSFEMNIQMCPAGRTGSEQDFAGTILFMTSQAGSYLNGETLVTDGGRLSQLPSVY